MSLRFVLGRAGSGKTSLCLAEMRRELGRNPAGALLIFLVPEQATYQTELALAAMPELGGIIRGQVLSFQRLGWRILAETGGESGTVIGPLGKRMLLRRILLQKRAEFKVLAKSVQRPGMADTLARMIGEFKAYRLRPGDLLQASQTGLKENFAEKLQDLALIFSEFEEQLSRGLSDPDSELSKAAEQIPLAETLADSHVWVDGFKGFTPQELLILEKLLPVCPEVTITLPLEPEFLHRNPEKGQALLPGEEMYLTSWRTCQDLLRIAHCQGIPLREPVLLRESKRFKEAGLKHLEQQFFAYPTRVFAESSPLRLLAAVNKREEVEWAAREMRRLSRDEGLRWREMAVLTRDLSEYAQLISDAFQAYEIPFFLDYKRTVVHHPLLEFLASVLEIARGAWNYEAVFRCLKTGFFPLSRDEIDRLENYCLAYGIQGRAWLQKNDWNYWRRPARQAAPAPEETAYLAEVNRIRKAVGGILAPYVERLLSEDVLPVRFVAGEIYSLLEELDIPGQLARLAEAAENRGDLDEARLQRQILEGVIGVFEEMVGSLGEEYLPLEDFALILASGLESLQLGLIPPALDQVLVGSLERSRCPEVKLLFLMGANDGILPARPSAAGLLDASERQALKEIGLELAPAGPGQLGEEQYFIYTGLTRASEKLNISFSLADPDGRALLPSPVIKRLKALFPNLKEEICLSGAGGWELVSHPGPLFQNYALQLGEKKAAGELPPLWQAVRFWYLQKPETARLIDFLENGPAAGNAERLSSPLVKRLYGKSLKASVSRLEQFSRCPFAHFARYGLRLEERRKYSLATPDLGQFFHRLLHDFAGFLRENGQDWGRISREESWEILGGLMERIVPELQNEILLSSARYRYLTGKLRQTVHHAVRVLAEHSRKGRFVPISLEVNFGDQGLPGLEIPLAGGESLSLVGQIDRIDAAYLNGEVYLRIFDYKSHPLTLSLDKVYHGISLQLLTYLDAALHGAEILVTQAKDMLGLPPGTLPGLLPAGFLYFPVIDPQLESTVRLTPEELAIKRLRAVRVDGYLLSNPEILQAMDEDLAQGQSHLLNLRLTKDGGFRQGSKVLSAEQFSILRAHLHGLFQEAGERILSGDISVHPFKMGKNSGCDYCLYNPVCHFETGLPGCTYRYLPEMGPGEVWAKLIQESGVRIQESEFGSQESGVRSRV